MEKLDNKSIQGFKRFFTALDPDNLTKDEFLSAFKKVVEHVKKIEKKTMEDMKRINDALNKVADSKLTDTEKKLMASLNNYVSSSDSTLKSKITELDKRLANIRDGIDGKDADEETIIGKVLSQIKLPEIASIEEDLPKMGKSVRDSLELLQDDERLDVSAIKGLKDKFDEIMKMINKEGNKLGGYPWAVQRGIETPSGTINGTNKAFTVTHKPDYVTLNGQIIYESAGYSFSNNTITFDSAPLTGGVLRSHYNVL
jgi:hypothetical protein